MTQARGEPLAIPQRRGLDDAPATSAARILRLVRGRARRFTATAAAYAGLTKPRIIVLLLVTTIPAMIAAEGGLPSVALMAATVIGGTLGAGGANALNCYFDRDIDRLMSRTDDRAVPAGRIAPAHAAIFGLVIGLAGVVLLAAVVNALASLLTAAAFAYYIVVYTLWLKRRTRQNIVIGGVAGAFPPMIGWAAVTGSVSLESIILFLIIFIWTPPHFWALALLKSEDYARAGIPMMPVACGEAETRKQILLYSIVLAPIGVAPSLLGFAGITYGLVATAGGLGMIWCAIEILRHREGGAARKASGRMFGFSILYLFGLFAVLLVEHLVLARFW